MQIKEKLKIKNSYKHIIRNIARRGVWFILSFVLSFSSVVGGSCPFAISLITVSSKKNFLFSAIGAGIGYIVFCDSDDAIRYFSAVIISALGTLAINLFNSRKEIYLPMLVSFLSVMSTGIVMNIKNSDVAGAYALTIGESILALGASFFFFRAAHCNLKRLKYKALPITDTTCLIVSAAVVLAGLSFLEIKGVSPARIAAVLVILIPDMGTYHCTLSRLRTGYKQRKQYVPIRCICLFCLSFKPFYLYIQSWNRHQLFAFNGLFLRCGKYGFFLHMLCNRKRYRRHYYGNPA